VVAFGAKVRIVWYWHSACTRVQTLVHDLERPSHTDIAMQPVADTRIVDL